ncbi:MAG: glutathione peroxidase [Hyphomicrobiaceae bacterium]|jgi:glutathione peroxidase
MFSKIEVNGDNACGLYAYLRSAQPGADGAGDIPWNFTKFLVDKNGKAIKRYEPTVTPEEIAKDLDQYL